MEFLQILDSPIEPGALVEWIPTMPGGLGSWARDPRATSHNHEQHLRTAALHRQQTGRTDREAWLGVAVEFDEQLSPDAAHRAVAGYIDRHEVLRTHTTIASDGTTERYTTGPGRVHVRSARIGWFSDPALLLEQIARSIDRAAAPLHWPAYRFATVARSGSFTLFFAADHSLVDGYSLVHAQHELREFYAAAVARRAPELPETGSYPDFSAAERAAADAADHRHTAVAVWKEFLDGGELPRFDPIPAAADDGSVAPQPSLSMLLLDAEATHRFRELCTRHDASLTGGLLAAAAGIYRRLTGADRFAMVMPRHTRHRAEFHTTLGWFVALAPVSIDISDDPDFPTALARAMVSLDRAREGASLPLLRLAELLDFEPEAKFAISFMDTRAAPDSASADAGAARVLRSHSYSADEVYVWINRTPAGLRMHARYPADRDGGRYSEILEGFFTDFRAGLVELAGTDSATRE